MAALLPNGEVLVAGGEGNCDAFGNCSPLSSAEIYTPPGGATSCTVPSATCVLHGSYNIAYTANSVTPSSGGSQGYPVTLNVTYLTPYFTDASGTFLNCATPTAVTFDWGDGTSDVIDASTIHQGCTSSPPGGFGEILRSHVYGQPSCYSVSMTVRDDTLGLSKSITDPSLAVGTSCGPKVAVLVEGIGSALPHPEDLSCGATSDDQTYQDVILTLIERGIPCSSILEYSYSGGKVDKTGAWQPKAYSCEDTGNQTIDKDVDKLAAMLNAYVSRHPGVQFVLIGHSLGGAVVLGLLERLGQPNGVPAADIADAITIDSPLNHVTKSNLDDLRKMTSVLGHVRCDTWFVHGPDVLLYGKPASELGDIVTDTDRSEYAQDNEAFVTAAQAAHVRVMTVGNAQDCVWNPDACGFADTAGTTMAPHVWHDDSSTQVIANADVARLYALGTGTCGTHLTSIFQLGCLGDGEGPHLRALHDTQVLSDIGAFIGPKIVVATP